MKSLQSEKRFSDDEKINIPKRSKKEEKLVWNNNW